MKNIERYIKQLIEDLEQVAKHPPAPSYIEPPEHLFDEPEIAELALVPFKTIEELTRIKQEEFPEINDLQDDQWERVNQAILKVFDSLNITLIDIPPEIPQEWLYDVLTTNWQHPVQYLPLTGMDLEFCTGDPQTCPYGEFCDCFEGFVGFEEYEIPEKFDPYINSIAQAIDAGFICYLNPVTLEFEEIPQALINDGDEFGIIKESGKKEEDFKHTKWDECYTFEPLAEGESFDIMESFMMNTEDDILSKELLNALNKKNPFSKFISVIEKSGQENSWKLFKTEWLKNHVKLIIFNNINTRDKSYDYNDDVLPFS